MNIDWQYDPATRVMHFTVGDNLRYESVDGGQNIKKYEDGEFVKLIRKYPEREGESILHEDGTRIWPTVKELGLNENNDEWPEELKWLVENYSDEIGEYHTNYADGYRTREGDIVDKGVWRGTGVNNLTDKISTNRIGIPASVQEWWDYEDLGVLQVPFDDAGLYAGKLYKIHTETGKLYVTGTENPPVPCCAFPLTYGPIEVTKEEVIEASKHPKWCSSGYDLNRL